MKWKLILLMDFFDNISLSVNWLNRMISLVHLAAALSQAEKMMENYSLNFVKDYIS